DVPPPDRAGLLQAGGTQLLLGRVRVGAGGEHDPERAVRHHARRGETPPPRRGVPHLRAPPPLARRATRLAVRAADLHRATADRARCSWTPPTPYRGRTTASGRVRLSRCGPNGGAATPASPRRRTSR